jgi:hypothetical protein
VKGSPVPNVILDPVRESLISSSGALLLRESIRVAGLDGGLSAALAPWRPAGARHDPGKILLDVATAIALGGDCLADLAAVRSPANDLRVGGIGPDRVAAVRGPGRRYRRGGHRDP